MDARSQDIYRNTAPRVFFPEPINASYVKIEYSNLQAKSYNPGNFQLPITYKKFPIWVTEYFAAQIAQPEFVVNTVGVVNNSLNLAYKYYLNDLKEGPAEPVSVPLIRKWNLKDIHKDQKPQ